MEPQPTCVENENGRRLARLGSGLLFVEVRCSAPIAVGGSTELVIGGLALSPPSPAVAFGPSEAPRLLFAVCHQVPDGALCEVRCGENVLAAFSLCAPQPATRLLLEGRAEAERDALLRFLLDTCAPLLSGDANPEFAALCFALARAGLPPKATAVPARALTRPGAALSLWDVGFANAGPEPWHLIDRGAIRRVGPPQDGVLVLVGAVPPEALLLPTPSGRPLALTMPEPLGGAGGPPPGLHDLLRRALIGGASPDEEAASRRAVAAIALRAAAGDRRCAGLLREAQLLAPARPRVLDDASHPVGGALELALPDGAGGLFLSGWVRDPLRLVTAFELRSPLGTSVVPRAALHRVARPDLTERFAKAPHGGAGATPGFVAHLPDLPAVWAMAQWRLRLRLSSGGAIELVAPPGLLPAAAARDLVLAAVAPAALRPELLDACVAPAVARLHAAALRDVDAAPEAIACGAAPAARPAASVVVPLYRNLRFLRFQIAAFARDLEFRRRAELVYVLDSPEQRGDVEQLLRGLSAMHDLPVMLVVQPENRGYASACNAGAAAACAPVLAMLNSDVIPARSGWLRPLLARLARERRLAAVGPKLLFADGSVQHAGLFFGRSTGNGEWFNNHYFKGFPRSHPAVSHARRVPAVTGAALLVRRAAFEAAGGFCTDYVVGDYEDSDLCLRLRDAGHEIAYEPASELFHFERQSIALHAGHAYSLASSYNRRLHHLRWDGTIAALMAGFPRH